jgi:hypothetical protein
MLMEKSLKPGSKNKLIYIRLKLIVTVSISYTNTSVLSSIEPVNPINNQS